MVTADGYGLLLAGQPDHARIALEMVRLGERRDWEFTRKDGQARMASLTVSEVTDGDGAVIGYIGAGDDITERLRAEEIEDVVNCKPLDHLDALVFKLQDAGVEVFSRDGMTTIVRFRATASNARSIRAEASASNSTGGRVVRSLVTALPAAFQSSKPP